MKKSLIYILFGITVLSLTSCERDFLAKWPPDGTRTYETVWGNYYETKGVMDEIYSDHIFAPYFNDVYDVSTANAYGMMASATDEAEHSVASASVQNFTNGVWNPTNCPTLLYGGPWRGSRVARTPWYNSYVGIGRCNIFLENVPGTLLIDDLDDPTRMHELTYYKGQAYFWRAYLSFVLLRNYGPYVISTHTETLDDNLFRGRNTLDECVAQIVKDCNSAIDSLPFLWDEANWGRVSATAAQALKSRVLLYYASPLYQGDFWSFGLGKGEVGDVQRWIDAADAAREAINDNDFYNLPKVNNFNRPYSADGSYNYVISLAANLDNVEQIFATGRTTSYSIQNEYHNLPAGVDGCLGYTNPTQEMVDEFEVVTGVGASRKAEKFDWNNPAHTKDPYANRDPRFYASIIYNGYLWGTAKAQAYYVDMYEPVTIDGIEYPGGVHRDRMLRNSTKTGYYYRKFLSESVYAYATGKYTTANRNRHEFRFAELLLNYAEALNEAYGPEVADPKGELREINGVAGINTARAAINAIRGRVNMPPVATGMTKEQMREAIHHERWVELCFEGHRFYDLRRWKEGDKLGQPIHGVLATPTGFDKNGRPTGFTYKVEKVEDRVWRDCMYWWPIPQSEVVKYTNGQFRQNPGW